MSIDAQLVKFRRDGWCRFDRDDAIAQWVEAVLPAARACVTAPENEKWLRSGGTWFVGVNALPNAPDGSVPGGRPLAGRAIEFAHAELGQPDHGWDRAQVSVVYSGYPKRMATESDAAFRYRVSRDAAHVDGLIREGENRRRFLRNFHRFILGITTSAVTAETSPLVVWEGSHEHVRRAFIDFFGATPSHTWPQQDVTKFYRELRRQIFATCKKVVLTASEPGEAYVIHRLALHGVAPWSSAAPDRAAARMVLYFRPESASPFDWLRAP